MDALHGAVGTFVQQATPGQGVVIVRGLKGSEVMHRVDGFRLNNAIFRNAPNQYLALVDAQNVDRIEVVRGPSSTLYGGDAMGGVVQMLTTEPRFAGSQWQSRGRVHGYFASADHALLGRAEFAAEVVSRRVRTHLDSGATSTPTPRFPVARRWIRRRCTSPTTGASANGLISTTARATAVSTSRSPPPPAGPA